MVYGAWQGLIVFLYRNGLARSDSMLADGYRGLLAYGQRGSPRGLADVGTGQTSGRSTGRTMWEHNAPAAGCACCAYPAVQRHRIQTEQEVKVIWQKAPHGGPIPRLGVTPGGRNLYHWIPGVGFPISVP